MILILNKTDIILKVRNTEKYSILFINLICIDIEAKVYKFFSQK